MKRIIMLGTVLVIILVSIGGCYFDPGYGRGDRRRWDEGRGGDEGRGRNEIYDRGGGHDRGEGHEKGGGHDKGEGHEERR
jgi:hypothetical protein